MMNFNLYCTPTAAFEEMVCDLLSQIQIEGSVLRLVFFGQSSGAAQYMQQREYICKTVAQYYVGGEPACSFVAQPLFPNGLALEVQSCIVQDGTQITYKFWNSITPYVRIQSHNASWLIVGGMQAYDLLHTTMVLQSTYVFEQIKQLMEYEGFAPHHIVRQWNYVEQITEYENDNQHYQILNNARSAYYDTDQWINGYPAATGIGSAAGGILIDFDACQVLTQECRIEPIDNKLQVAAHAYSDQVLLEADKQKATPKFERAKRMVLAPDETFIYVSGTAAIRGELSLETMDVVEQLHITMENIAELVGDCPLDLLRVYIKHVADFEQVSQALKAYELNIPIVYLHSDVCRPELLIEIEGIAHQA